MRTATRWSRGVMGTVAALWLTSTLTFTLTLAGALVGGRPAQAAPFISRGLTLPSGQFELGLGLGLGHNDIGETGDQTGLGVNIEVGYGLTPKLEFRFRTGLRFGDDGRFTWADYFGRPVETETYNLGYDTLANPEVGVRLRLLNGATADVGFDARMYIPVDEYFGFLLGLPLQLHLGDRVRVDTGLYMPIILADPDTVVDISLPLHVWFRLDGGTFLGPITGVVFRDNGGERVPFGVGAGTALAYDADLRFWLLFPEINRDGGGKDFGLGAGLYVTF